MVESHDCVYLIIFLGFIFLVAHFMFVAVWDCRKDEDRDL